MLHFHWFRALSSYLIHLHAKYLWTCLFLLSFVNCFEIVLNVFCFLSFSFHYLITTLSYLILGIMGECSVTVLTSNSAKELAFKFSSDVDYIALAKDFLPSVYICLPAVDKRRTLQTKITWRSIDVKIFSNGVNKIQMNIKRTIPYQGIIPGT